jgi:NAD(P)-dependent dehydrogenase (short-subunit alcohol dehydrogenase family)
LLVANAGTATAVPFAKATADQFRDMFEQHVLGMLYPVQMVLDGMIERGFGRIVAIASIVGLRASPNVAPYTTAKHGMIGLMRSIALETAGKGVTVNAVCPGYVDTELIRGPLDKLVERGTTKEEAMARFTSRVPVGRLVTPAEVAEAVLYFCSPGAAATTGATLVIGADGV